MAQFLTTNAISDRLDGIISEAGEEVILVSPYVQLNANLIERLKDADKKGVKITLIYGKEKEKFKPEEKEKLDSLKNVSVYFHPNLHAKCYQNEKELIIASMNLYDFSEKRNREMGVLVQRGEDDGAYRKAADEVQSILRASEPVRRGSGRTLVAVGKVLTGVVNAVAEDVMGNPSSGFCIRCCREIDLNPDKPFCPDCYSKWCVYKNPNYAEQCCHQCGRVIRSTMARPLCRACYERY